MQGLYKCKMNSLIKTGKELKYYLPVFFEGFIYLKQPSV